MLNWLRRSASTWAGKILGAILIVGMAGFGISNVLLDLGSTTVARVGGEEITTQEFQRAYQQQLNQFAQQTGSLPTNEQALQMGLPSVVITRLAADAALNQFAVGNGLGISDARLGALVRQDPNFGNTLGAFDRTAFQQVLRQNGYTEVEYFDLKTREALRQQIGTGLFDGTSVSNTALQLLNSYSGDTRTIEYFTINQTALPPVADPTDSDLEAYLKAHQADYRTKETRTAEVLLLTPDILAAQIVPTDDEIKAEYDRTKDDLVKLEKRDIQQVVLPNQAAIDQFQAAKDAGTKFADILKTSGLAVTDLGLLSKAGVTDPKLADAAFALHEGDFVLIDGIGGKRVISVSKIEGGGAISYDDAKAQIAKTLALNAARTQYADMLDQVEELRAAFKPLKDIAERFKLKVTPVTLLADGAALSDVPGMTDDARAKLAPAIFAAKRDKLAPTVSINGNQTAWFDLDTIAEARDQTLAEVHDAIATAWTNEKTDEALQAEVKAIMAELDGGKKFADVAASRSQFATLSQPITRQGDNTPVLNQAVATAAFSKGPDSHGWAQDGDGEYLVFHVVEVQKATGTVADKTRTFLEGSTRGADYDQFIDGLRTAAGITINQQAMSQLLATDPSGQ